MKLASSKLLTTTILTAALALAACSRGVVYTHFEHVDIHDWPKADTLFFTATDFPDSDTYHAQLSLRTSPRYPFMALSLVVRARAAKSGYAYTDTLTVDLALADGSRPGEGFNIRQHDITLPSPTLAPGDTLTVAVSHDMRRNHLGGIAAVGFILSH